jgi:hypothetical protein
MKSQWFGRAALALAACSAAGAAFAADSWVFGSSLVAPPNQVAYFARYVAPGAPGQIVVRCDTVEGVSIDAGAVNAAAAANPAPAAAEGAVSVRFTHPSAGGAPPVVETVDAVGEQRLRSDGAVIVTFTGESANTVAKALAQPLDKLEVLVGEASADIVLEGMAEVMETLARVCSTWPN